MLSSIFAPAIAALSVLAAIADVHAAHAAQRNILMIIADDYGVDVAAWVPTSLGRLETSPKAPPQPTLMQLAQQGVTFKVTVQQECSPTRSEEMTGRYAFRTGIGEYERDGGPQLKLSEFTLAEAFNKAGLSYQVSAVGKWHLSEGLKDPNLQGFGYYAGYLGAHGGGALGHYYGFTETINGVNHYQPGYATTVQVDKAIGRIQAAKAAAKPYFIYLAFNTPHIPYHVPPLALHHEGNLPPFQNGMNPDPYFRAAVESMDTEIGRLLKSVDLKTTTVIFFGDNGTARGDIEGPYNPHHGKSSIYQQGIEVPMLIAGAGVANPGRATNDQVSGVDIFTTTLALAGINQAAVVPPGVKIDGKSIAASVTGTAATGRAYSYSDGFKSNYDDMNERSMRDQFFKLIQFGFGKPKLYDLRQDPLEANDLALHAMNAEQLTHYNALKTEIKALTGK